MKCLRPLYILFLSLLSVLCREVRRICQFLFNDILEQLLLDEFLVFLLQVVDHLLAYCRSVALLRMPEVVLGLRYEVNPKLIDLVLQLKGAFVSREVVLDRWICAAPGENVGHGRVQMPQILLLAVESLVVGVDLGFGTQDLMMSLELARVGLARVEGPVVLEALSRQHLFDFTRVFAPLLEALSDLVGVAPSERHLPALLLRRHPKAIVKQTK